MTQFDGLAAHEWAGILDNDERILWQGRPVPKLRLEYNNPFEPFFYVFFTGFSLFWMRTAAKAGGYFWMFGLLFFSVGCFGLIGVHFWRRFERSHTYYTLTDRRAFIAKDPFGRRSLKSYPLSPDTAVEHVEGRPGSVYFATEIKGGYNGATRVAKIGFELIEDARTITARIKDIQNRATQRGKSAALS